MDREKVIKAVEEAFDLVHSDFIGTDDFNETEWEQNKADVLALLKEQEANRVQYITDDYTGTEEPHCPKCGCYIDQYNPRRPWQDVKYCCYCGQEVTWN